MREEGITLIEIIVVIFIIVIFSMILVVNFPTILKQYALSRVTYKLAQDLRKTEDLGLSGVPLYDISGKTQIKVKGYGIYINLNNTNQYSIYADVNGSESYDGDTSFPFCNSQAYAGTKEEADCVIDTIDLSKENSSLYIKSLNDEKGFYNIIDINFTPPDPTTTITAVPNSPINKIDINLTNNLSTSSVRTVTVNKSGLIDISK
jgi:type II secretory pathway pseudopilin PulG